MVNQTISEQVEFALKQQRADEQLSVFWGGN